MSSTGTGLFIMCFLLVLMALGVPIAFALGLTALAAIVLFLQPAQLDFFGQFVFDSVNSFALLTIPLFIFMGAIFGGSKAGADLFEAGHLWLHKIRGGLAMSSVVASAMFAALCGSSAATAAAIGKVAIPQMRKRGYSDRISAGAVVAGGTLGILIPPSVTLILYGIATEQSIGRLFAGGIIPGLGMTAFFCLWIYVASRLERRRGLPGPAGSEEPSFPASGGSPDGTSSSGRTGGGATVSEHTLVQTVPESTDVAALPEITWRKRILAVMKVLPFLALISGVLAALYLGVATPSESAAVGAFLALVLVVVIYRSLTVEKFSNMLLDATGESTMVMMIVAFSAVLGQIMSFLAIPQDLAMSIQELDVNRWVVMLVIMLLLLVLGFFLLPVAIILMTTPVLYPIITELGFDPIWFGVIMSINMEMGLITPPVGLNLYVVKGVAPDISLGEILRGSIPYVAIIGMAIVLYSVFPEIITWLPDKLFEK
ncbi:MAG TPA: TRAP transporter large permease [Segeticoccus sp.]|jgi:TRAP-type C4-dicarboxylate transport system permease large subunit|nr:TRAP transporter large permease [Segeticoccus sp.]